MLARMNFASQLAGNQKFRLATAAAPHADTPERLLDFVLDALRTAPFDGEVTQSFRHYLNATGPWTGSTAQVRNKVAGLVHLVAGTREYQFV